MSTDSSTDSLIPAGYTVTHDGFTFRIEFTPDEFTNPHDETCWSAEERHQWNLGNWRFATLTVAPVLPYGPTTESITALAALTDSATVDVCGVAVGECLGEWTANPHPLANDLALESLARLRNLTESGTALPKAA